MQKALIVYYSYEGNTRFIAESIAHEIKADMLELKPKKELSSKGNMKYFWGGAQVIFKERPKLHPLSINPEITMFYLSAHLYGRGPSVEKSNLRDAIPDNIFLGESDYYNPLANNKQENCNKAKQWVREIMHTI